MPELQTYGCTKCVEDHENDACPSTYRQGNDYRLVLLNCCILYIPNSADVHERSGRSEPSTSTCHHLPLAAASNTCIAVRCARSHNTAHSYWVAITYVFCCKCNVKKCTVNSHLFLHPGPVTQQQTMCGCQLLCLARTPPFILHTNNKCVYTYFIDGLCNWKESNAAAKCKRRFPRGRDPSKRTLVALRRYLTRKW